MLPFLPNYINIYGLRDEINRSVLYNVLNVD